MTTSTALSALAPARLRSVLLLTAAVASTVVVAQGTLLRQTVASLVQPALRGSLSVPSRVYGPDEVRPFYLIGDAGERERAARCLTDALYYEAANEPVEGQRAIAQVVVNRVRDPHFPRSVCGVVYQGWERKTGCQFSFVCDGSIVRRHADPVAWARLRPIAVAALSGYVDEDVGTSTHYYATYVKPNWVRSVAKVADIGKHVFCSWKGKAGQASALTASYLGGEYAIAEAVLDGLHGPAGARELKRQGIA